MCPPRRRARGAGPAGAAVPGVTAVAHPSRAGSVTVLLADVAAVATGPAAGTAGTAVARPAAVADLAAENSYSVLIADAAARAAGAAAGSAGAAVAGVAALRAVLAVGNADAAAGTAILTGRSVGAVTAVYGRAAGPVEIADIGAGWGGVGRGGWVDTIIAASAGRAGASCASVADQSGVAASTAGLPRAASAPLAPLP